MKFHTTGLDGAFLVEIEPHIDERGFFARTFCHDEFANNSLCTNFVQCNTSFNIRRGTLRGMHYQAAPCAETKLIRCTRGAIYDVIVDIRTDSATCRQWIGVKLTADDHRMLYVPEGFAHGFQTLEDNSEVFYQMGAMYHPDAARGLRWNDPVFDIGWPLANPIVSERDADYPDFTF